MTKRCWQKNPIREYNPKPNGSTVNLKSKLKNKFCTQFKKKTLSSPEQFYRKKKILRDKTDKKNTISALQTSTNNSQTNNRRIQGPIKMSLKES